MDRDDTLRKAEKLLHQGRLEAAIAEYAKVLVDQPRDWTTAKILGDLYVRAGQIERAVGQYAHIAEHLAREGFISKATALYKKIVKIHPDDDTALLRAAELAAQQGLTADARVYLQSLFQQRLRRADQAGAAKVAAAYAKLDPADAAGCAESARMFAELGDHAGAAVHMREAGRLLRGAGKVADATDAWRQALRFSPNDEAASGLLVRALLDQGDPDEARAVATSGADWRAVAEGLSRAGRDGDAYSALGEALRADPADVASRVQFARAAMACHDDARAREVLAPLGASTDPVVHFAMAEAEFRSGAVERGRATLQRCLSTRADLAAASIDLGCSVGPGDPEMGLAIITSVVLWAESSGDTDLAVDALDRFLAAAPGNVAALEELVRVSGHPFYENQQYRAQIQLTEVYLAIGSWSQARSLAEQLLVARPDDVSHSERLARALTGLGVPNVEAVVRAYVRRLAMPDGLSDFGALLPRRSSLAEDLSSADRSAPTSAWAAVVSGDARATLLVPPERPARGPSPAPGAESDQLVVVDGVDDDSREPPPPAPPDRDIFEIDLSGDLEDLTDMTQPVAAVPDAADPGPVEPERGADGASRDGAQGLEGFFHGLREQTGRHLDGLSAALAYGQASEHFNRGDVESAVECLRAAARDPVYRFRAASMLARIARDQQRLSEAVEWLERAGEAPAPSTEASHGLLYELADTLEAAGEDARALAVLLELQSIAPGYRDVRERLAQLSPGQAGRPGPPRGSA
jgi:tetratricopeptide (TPR) repeat protein